MLNSIEYPVLSGADEGKNFIIQRMPLFTADKWARHFIKSLAEAGEKLLESVIHYPVRNPSELAVILFGKLNLEALEKNLETLLNCCQIKNPLNETPRKITEEDIEDPMTLVELRTKAFELHLEDLHAAYRQVIPLNVIFEFIQKDMKEA